MPSASVRLDAVSCHLSLRLGRAHPSPLTLPLISSAAGGAYIYARQEIDSRRLEQARTGRKDTRILTCSSPSRRSRSPTPTLLTCSCVRLRGGTYRPRPDERAAAAFRGWRPNARERRDCRRGDGRGVQGPVSYARDGSWEAAFKDTIAEGLGYTMEPRQKERITWTGTGGRASWRHRSRAGARSDLPIGRLLLGMRQGGPVSAGREGLVQGH